MKQIGTALAMYAQDYDEQYPSGRFNPAIPLSADYGKGWAGQIYAQTKNGQIFRCPDDSTSQIAATASNPILYPSSYVYNYNIALSSAMASMNAPAQTVILAEVTGDVANVTVSGELPSTATPMYSASGNGLTVLTAVDGTNMPGIAGTAKYDTGPLGGYKLDSAPQVPYPAIFKSDKGRHSDGGIFCMSDGHAKFFKSQAVSPGQNAVASTNVQDTQNGYAAGTEAGQQAVTFSLN